MGNNDPEGNPGSLRQYTYISKRKGFPQANYKIELLKWDDDLYIFINGVRVPYTGEYNGSNKAWSSNPTTVTPCIPLDANSTIEVRSHGNGAPNSSILKITPVNINIDVVAPSDFTTCNGTISTLDATDNSTNILPSSVTYAWTGANIISGNTTLSPKVQPDTTTTYQLVSSYDRCTDTAHVTITLPIKTNVLSVDKESATCYVKGNDPIHFYEPTTGHYIGSINPNGRIGTITMTSYIHSIGTNAGVDDGTMYACNSPLNELYRTAFLGRSFTVVPTGTISGSGDMDVYLPFTGTEFSNLSYRATNYTPGNVFDNISSISTIVATKYHNPGAENRTPYDNCTNGTSEVLGNSGTGTTDLNSYGVTPSITADYARFKVNSFSEFYLHGQIKNSPLPIELTAFSGNCVANGIELTWTTATESNVNHFEILRSRDGISWNLLANIPAVGNSSVSNTYSTLDANVSETLYYRLRSVDNDGTAQEYAPLSVVCQSHPISWTVFPVPASNNIAITIQSNDSFSTLLDIVDMEGRTLYSKPIQLTNGVNLINVDIRKYAGGTYFIHLKQNRELTPLKFIKMD